MIYCLLPFLKSIISQINAKQNLIWRMVSNTADKCAVCILFSACTHTSTLTES